MDAERSRRLEPFEGPPPVHLGGRTILPLQPFDIAAVRRGRFQLQIPTQGEGLVELEDLLEDLWHPLACLPRLEPVSGNDDHGLVRSEMRPDIDCGRELPLPVP